MESSVTIVRHKRGLRESYLSALPKPYQGGARREKDHFAAVTPTYSSDNATIAQKCRSLSRMEQLNFRPNLHV